MKRNFYFLFWTNYHMDFCENSLITLTTGQEVMEFIGVYVYSEVFTTLCRAIDFFFHHRQQKDYFSCFLGSQWYSIVWWFLHCFWGVFILFGSRDFCGVRCIHACLCSVEVGQTIYLECELYWPSRHPPLVMLASHCDKFAEKLFEILNLDEIKIGYFIEVLLCHKKYKRKREPTPPVDAFSDVWISWG